MSRRVVVTGAAALCPLGQDWPTIRSALMAKRSAIQRREDWARVQGLRTNLAAEVPNFTRPSHYTRKQTRSMGRVSLLAARASELAMEMAGWNRTDPGYEQTGLAYGSTSGSPPALEQFVSRLIQSSVEGLSGTEFIQAMSHTCVLNLAQFFGLRGRIISTCTACTSGSQAIGSAYESIKFGCQEIMVAGGAEELHCADAAVFDLLLSTSTRNDTPQKTPRPFDVDRDGLVVGEGAAALVVESLEHARKRGANILAEIAGYASNCDGRHVVHPSAEGMHHVMELALKDAALSPDAIDYVNAHATATQVGDVAESIATRNCFKRAIPISSLKGSMGHTLGACGAIDGVVSVHQLNEGWLAPTVNLEQVDPQCAPLDYLTEVREGNFRCLMSNNYAFGGINTSLIFKQWRD